MTAHLLHGYNVTDGGQGTIARWAPYLERRGFDVAVHDLGRKRLLTLRRQNREAVARLLDLIKPGDVIGAHSNAALVTHKLVRAGAPLAAVVVFQPALRRDTYWPPYLPVLNVCNGGDLVVQFGRVWGRLSTIARMKAHGWGAAGRYGFTTGQPNVINRFTDDTPGFPVVTGHSTIFKSSHGRPHLDAAARWMERAVVPGLA